MTANTDRLGRMLRHPSNPFTWLLLLTALAAEAQSSATVEDWLELMSKAMHSLNYEGEMIYQHGNALELLQMVHTVQDGRERERLTALNGLPREIIRDQDSVVCVLPGSRSMSVDQRGGGYGFPSLLPLSLHELSEVYQIRFAGDERIAGRDAKGIDIIPRDGFRYGHRLYLDQEHYLPLKQVMLDEKGKRVVQIMYSRIRVDPAIPHESSAPSIRSRDYALVRHKARSGHHEMGLYHWSFTRLPSGFQIGQRDLRHGEDGEIVEHLVLSDGLASVSLYIEKAHAGGGLVGASRMGAMSAFGRRAGDEQITVVGEVPEATVRFIAEAVEVSR